MLAGVDVGLTQHLRAVIHKGLELHICGGSRKNVPARCQNLRCLLDSHSEVASHGRESRQKQVTEIVSFKIAGTGETKLKKLGEKIFVFRERHETVANIARRKHTQLAAQAATGSAIVTHGNQRG